MTLVNDGDSHIQLPLQSKGILYFVELQSSEYDGKTLGSNTLPALIDTGTSLNIAPADEYNKLKNAL